MKQVIKKHTLPGILRMHKMHFGGTCIQETPGYARLHSEHIAEIVTCGVGYLITIILNKHKFFNIHYPKAQDHVDGIGYPDRLQHQLTEKYSSEIARNIAAFNYGFISISRKEYDALIRFSKLHLFAERYRKIAQLKSHKDYQL